uniref:Uncharacterized protein n=1 Tax=Ditylenchus dipsaci TaxID=166011 RepID=A0A915EQR9_9BILA
MQEAFKQVCQYVPFIKHSANTPDTLVVVIAHFSKVKDFEDTIQFEFGERKTVHSSHGVGADDEEKYGSDDEELEEREKELDKQEFDQNSDYAYFEDPNEPCSSLTLSKRRAKREIDLDCLENETEENLEKAKKKFCQKVKK